MPGKGNPVFLSGLPGYPARETAQESDVNALSGLILATIAAGAAVAEDVGYRFEWQGADGYAMQGRCRSTSRFWAAPKSTPPT